jgi:hypothetical protein
MIRRLYYGATKQGQNEKCTGRNSGNRWVLVVGPPDEQDTGLKKAGIL